jgi:uncharacterized protein YqhQ
MDEKFKLEKELEKEQEQLQKENKKTFLVMTIYQMVVCGVILYMHNKKITDIIIPSVLGGVFISWIGLMVYSFYTSLYTCKESLQYSISRLKIQIEELDKKYRDDLR